MAQRQISAVGRETGELIGDARTGEAAARPGDQKRADLRARERTNANLRRRDVLPEIPPRVKRRFSFRTSRLIAWWRGPSPVVASGR